MHERIGAAEHADLRGKLEHRKKGGGWGPKPQYLLSLGRRGGTPACRLTREREGGTLREKGKTSLRPRHVALAKTVNLEKKKAAKVLKKRRSLYD